jgi:predicted RNase H-like HicB family nuclease
MDGAMKAKAKRRRAIFERDATGWWVASVPSVAGCHTQGRTLAQARERLKEALAVSVEGDRPNASE